VPAISFDPPVGSPGGVTRLEAAYAATRTAVSPDGRTARPRRRGGAWDAEQAEPQAAPAPLPDEDAEPLPVYYPPLGAQRAVLDRPVEEPPPCYEPPPAVSWPEPLAPDADSALEQHLRRVMGVAPD
jgi:hypothetical protein